MNTASNFAQNARDSLKEAREGVREVGRSRLCGLKRHPKRLAGTARRFQPSRRPGRRDLAAKGNAAWQRAKTSVDGVVSDAQAKGQEAAGAMRDVSDNFVEAIDESIKERPYATLAIAAALGFMFGVAWRR